MNSVVLTINLCWRPFVLILLAIVIELSAERLPMPIVANLAPIANLASCGLILAALMATGWSGWKLWSAMTGRGELCHGCAGPTRLVEIGRYGPYYKCLACGNNRSVGH